MKKILISILVIVSLFGFSVSNVYNAGTAYASETQVTEQEVLDKLNSAHYSEFTALLEMYHNVLGIDLAKYQGLTAVQKNDVNRRLATYRYDSIHSFCKIYDRTIENVKESVSGGGSTSGGGGGGESTSSYVVYELYDDYGETIQQPTEDMPIKLRANINNETEGRYTVIVFSQYTADGALKEVKIGEVEGILSGDIVIDINSTYTSGSYVKVMTLDGFTNLKPMREASMEYVDNLIV